MNIQSDSGVTGAVELEQQEEQIVKTVRFDNTVEVLPLDEDESDQENERRWLSQDDIASFREESLRTVQAVRAFEKGGEPLDEENFCSRGLEQKMLNKPPPNFVRRVLRLQVKQRQTGSDPATSLQLFSVACSKWARKRAVQLAAEDEYEAYQIFMAGLRKQQEYDHESDDLDDDVDDDEYYGDEEFDFCTEGGFVNGIYDYKHEPTEDETEFDDSDAYDTIVAVDKDANAMDPFMAEDEDAFMVRDEDDILTPVC